MADRVILYATDYSDASQYALEYACSLARDLGARLAIAHVSDQEFYPVGEAFGETPHPSPQELERLHEVRPIYSDLKHEYHLIYGPPTAQTMRPEEQILRCADELGAYAIVVGTHGRTGLKRALMGSTAEALIRQARCPVITVRCPAKLEEACA